MYHDIPKFFAGARPEHVLSAITLIWRLLKPKSAHGAWRDFVARAMREENLGFIMDDAGGVHPLVDEEFERNRVSALRAADAPQFAAVREAFERSHSYLEAEPADTKASVRSMFEALEILAVLMDPSSNRLTKGLVVGNLKKQALATVADSVEKKSLDKMFDGLGNWVDVMHVYRHGQGTRESRGPFDPVRGVAPGPRARRRSACSWASPARSRSVRRDPKQPPKQPTPSN